MCAWSALDRVGFDHYGRIDQAGIHRQIVARPHAGPGRNLDVLAHGFNDAVADDDRRSLDRLAGLYDDGRTGDGVGANLSRPYAVDRSGLRRSGRGDRQGSHCDGDKQMLHIESPKQGSEAWMLAEKSRYSGWTRAKKEDRISVA